MLGAERVDEQALGMPVSQGYDGDWKRKEGAQPL